MLDQFDLFASGPQPDTDHSPEQSQQSQKFSSQDPAPTVDVTVAPLTAEEKLAHLEAIRAPALSCPRCKLSRTRTNVVFGEGNAASPLMLVGEGPGESEDASGRPFVGRAGKLLEEVLRRNGMARHHVYVTNVIKCRAANFEGGRMVNRPPEPDEISACQPWLEQQTSIIKPLVVVCIGGPAANTVIHKNFRITAERGKWCTTSPYAAWTMAVFHPAYILRLNGPAYDAALETLVEDVGRARQKVIEVKRQLKETRESAAPPPPRNLFD